MVWKLAVAEGHRGIVLGGLELLGWHRACLVGWHLDVVAISDLFKFNVRYFLMVHLGAIVIRSVPWKFGEVVHVSYRRI